MIIDIRTHNYFPIHFIVLGVGLFAYGVLTFLSYPFVSIILIPVGVLFSTTQYRFRIDTEKKQYLDYMLIFGFKRGTWYDYETPNFFYINTGYYSQSHGPVAIRFNTDLHKYNAFLKLDEDNNINLGESSIKRILVNRIDTLNEGLRIPVKEVF